MSTTERNYLLEILQTSQKDLFATVEDVDAPLFHYKANEKDWSIAEIIEHIIIADQSIFRGILYKSKSHPDTIPQTMDNEAAKTEVVHFGRKIQAPDYLIPKGAFETKAEAMKAFQLSRKKIETFVETTQLPLEKIAFKHFIFGLLNAKNWVAFLGGHCERHRQQIERVKSNFLISTSTSTSTSKKST